MLTKAALDPVARIPEFKACAVHVARADRRSPAAAAPSTAHDVEISSPSYTAEVT
jgi:hypothetical protein